MKAAGRCLLCFGVVANLEAFFESEMTYLFFKIILNFISILMRLNYL